MRRIPILYAKADPMISHPVAKPPTLDSAAPMEWIGVGFGLLVATLMAFGGLKKLGMSATAIMLFFLLCGSFFLLGLPLGGLIKSGESYTVQVGDGAFSSPSFNNWHPGGLDFTINGGVLSYLGHRYDLPHHAHVWFRDGQVLINGVAR